MLMFCSVFPPDKLKAQIEQYRMTRVMQGKSDRSPSHILLSKAGSPNISILG